MERRKGLLRNFVFGAEDGLVSTVGLLSGVSFAGLSSKAIIISGVVLIIVEALSMGAGAYISEDSSNDLEPLTSQKENSLADALVMFLSYLVIGLIPLLPYTLIGTPMIAFYWSLALTLIALFLLGLFKGYAVHRHPLKSAFKMVAIGGGVTLIAVYVGLMIGRS